GCGPGIGPAACEIREPHAELVLVAVAKCDVRIADGGIASGLEGMAAELQVDRVLGDERSTLPLRVIRWRPVVAVLLIVELYRRDLDVQFAREVPDVDRADFEVALDAHQ